MLDLAPPWYRARADVDRLDDLRRLAYAYAGKHHPGGGAGLDGALHVELNRLRMALHWLAAAKGKHLWKSGDHLVLVTLWLYLDSPPIRGAVRPMPEYRTDHEVVPTLVTEP